MTTILQPESSSISGTAHKRLKIFDSLRTSQSSFCFDRPALEDDGLERYEVFRRSAAKRGAVRQNARLQYP